MKTRHSILTLAVGASLALGVPTAQATVQLGEGSFSAGTKNSSEISATTLTARRAEYQHLMNSYKKQGVHHIGQPGPGGGVSGS
jgi:hypothetical protein